MPASHSQHSALPIDALMHLYCEQQGRALRLFDGALNVLFDNAPDRLKRFPIFRDAKAAPVAIPPAGPERFVWPVTRALADGRPAERIYWQSGPEGKEQGFRIRAWILTDDPAHGSLAIEETELADSRLAPGARVRELDMELAELIHRVSQFLSSNDAPDGLHLRLTNPHLDRGCKELRECTRCDCETRGGAGQLRCWEVDHQQCDESGALIEDPLGKLQYCENCEVFLLACPDPLTRVGENLNRLLSLLQMKHAEAMEAQQHVQQAEKLAMIGELMAGLAHEIKTPLSVIMGRLECIEMEIDRAAHPDLVEDLDVMQSHAERAVKIMDDVLNLARPQPPHRRSVHVNDDIRSAAKMLRKTLEEGGIALDLQLGGQLPEVIADPIQMQQVFCNLILNARDAMPDGGCLTIRSWRPNAKSSVVRVSIADTGCGIEPVALGRIFMPFYSTKRDKGGTGLGLAICRRIMIQQGGRIEVESALGTGTTFSLIFAPAVEEANEFE